MKCHYCQQEMIKRSEEFYSQKSGEDSSTVTIAVWQCDNHAPVIFRQANLSTGFKAKGSIFVPLKDKWYQILLDSEEIWIEELKEEEDNPTSFTLKKVVATKVNPNWNITPDNAIDKLQTYLLFL